MFSCQCSILGWGERALPLLFGFPGRFPHMGRPPTDLRCHVGIHPHEVDGLELRLENRLFLLAPMLTEEFGRVGRVSSQKHSSFEPKCPMRCFDPPQSVFPPSPSSILMHHRKNQVFLLQLVGGRHNDRLLHLSAGLLQS